MSFLHSLISLEKDIGEYQKALTIPYRLHKRKKTRRYPDTLTLWKVTAKMPYEPWVAVPTLVCSSLSAVATGAVILMWAFSSHDEKHSFRYALVMNLTIAGKWHSRSAAVSHESCDY